MITTYLIEIDLFCLFVNSQRKDMTFLNGVLYITSKQFKKCTIFRGQQFIFPWAPKILILSTISTIK